MKKMSDRKFIAVLLLADVLLIGVFLCVFALFHHVLPRRFKTVDLNPITETLGDFESDADDDPVETPADPIEAFKASVMSSKRYGESPLGEREITDIGVYYEDNASIYVYSCSYGEGDDKVTYYTADFTVSDLSELKTYVCTTARGSVTDGLITDVVRETGAALCVNGDYFKSRSQGTYIRNGVLYLHKPTQGDICLLYADGTMECKNGRDFNAREEIAKGVWQAWTFGPNLFDEAGCPILKNEDFNISGSYILNRDETSGIYGFQNDQPRTAIGYFESGHYILVVVDGRSEGHSKGVTLPELAQLMYDEGCKVAYNLDGGGSSMLWFNARLQNDKWEGIKNGRKPSDYIYISFDRKED